MIFPIVQLEKNPPKTQKKETEREKKLFPLHPFIKKKRKKKKLLRVKKQCFFIYIKLPKRVG